ncbi:DUF6644 family protein [Sphingomonas sp. MMS24-J13]|uniref:DUF6644 family protein n=1 Tax=Sphingomonas sp. MMS24-J13 TaxID=3238686 RepID=UPI00385150CC
MGLKAFSHALETSAVGDYIASSAAAFPLLESIHVIAIVTVFGTVAMMDLRLLGLASTNRTVTAVSHDTLRLTWGAFAVALATGSLLFVSRAASYTVNPYFLWKMVLLLLAGLNMALFHAFTWRGVERWNAGSSIPLAAKVAGGLSLLFWVAVVFCGRVIGFTLGVYV